MSHQPVSVPSFLQRDPSQADFWDARFAQQCTPWDQGGVPAQLAHFVAQASVGLAVLIPGCGTGHEVRHFAQAGWDVTAIDFSAAAVTAAKSRLGEFAAHVHQADFFSFIPPQPPAFIYERAFLCALPRARWPAVVQRWATLLPPGGLLGGFFFFDDVPKGPPFGADPLQLAALMSTVFDLLEDCAVADSIPIFDGKERWQLWWRRQD
jgi:SAM-dependent methyltransferase